MSRSGTRVQLFVAFTIVGYVTAEYTINSNGWMPVSPDKVYNQIRREVEYTSRYQSSKHDDELKQSNDAFSALLQRASEKEHRKDVVIDEEHLDNQYKLGPVTFQQETSEIDQYAIHNRESIRKAKKIAEYVVNEEVNDDIGTAEQESKEEENIKIIQRIESGSDGVKSGNEARVMKQDFTNIYEVTESPNVDYIIENQNDLSKPLQHNPPVIQNLTSKFFDILTKYNIKANDNLQNYRLSKLDKARFLSKENYRVPGLTSYRYNNPNHMPIDPLFAVFLSSYGVYLPGMYGINNNNNNRYGYLASNNIHNNKPFGLYKIYSDTDSSN